MKVEYQNSTRLMAVIGDPIAHSLSPVLHNTMIKELGLDYLYLAFPVKRGELPAFLDAAKTLGLCGFNMTMPHKEDFIPFAAALTPEAQACGSVNSVRVEDGKFYGHSTDGIGFRRAMQDLGVDFPEKNVTILGAGGAAKSIAVTAIASGAASLKVVNRTPARAEALCAGLDRAEGTGMERVEEFLRDTDILINTTPVGMEGVAGGAAFPYLKALKPGAAAFDCIYAPSMTPFMAEAKALGHPVANGIGMLVYQAIYAFSFFTGMEFDEKTVTHLGKCLLEASGIHPRGEA